MSAMTTEHATYARIAFLRPHDGHTVDFEAGYIRHLEWHRQAKDPWVWYGWSIWAGERQRWFVYASFGHSAASLDSPVAPAEDERDNISNVTPHAQFVGNGLYEYLPGLSRVTGEPQPTARLELTTVDLVPGAEKAFEAALSTAQSGLRGETLWYRMVAGGAAPRYVRLRPRPSLSAILDDVFRCLAVTRGRVQVVEDARRADDRCLLGMRQWNLDDLDAEERRVWILVRRQANTAGQLTGRADTRRAGDVHVDIVGILRIDQQRVRV